MLEQELKTIYDITDSSSAIEQEAYRELLRVLEVLSSNPELTDKLEIKKLYLRYLRASLRLSTNNPLYGDDISYPYENCYMYALGLKGHRLFSLLWQKFKIDVLSSNVGFTTNESRKSVRTKEKLLERLYTDCEELKIEVYDSDIDSEPRHGGFKVTVYMCKVFDQTLNGYDFHFIRQNSDGIWSEKFGRDGEIRRIGNIRDKFPYEIVKTVEIVKPVIREQNTPKTLCLSRVS